MNSPLITPVLNQRHREPMNSPLITPVLEIEVPEAPAPKPAWTRAEALALCTIVEQICPKHGCHVALTGGLLYREGPRKDCDLLFYRIRQVEEIDIDGLFDSLRSIGLVVLRGFGWCYKAEFFGKSVDCFFPEEPDGEYTRGTP